MLSLILRALLLVVTTTTVLPLLITAVTIITLIITVTIMIVATTIEAIYLCHKEMEIRMNIHSKIKEQLYTTKPKALLSCLIRASNGVWESYINAHMLNSMYYWLRITYSAV